MTSLIKRMDVQRDNLILPEWKEVGNFIWDEAIGLVRARAADPAVVEVVAFTLWKADASPLKKSRTLSVWEDQSMEVRDGFKEKAKAAIAAFVGSAS